MSRQRERKAETYTEKVAKWETPYCTYMMEWTEKLGYEKTKEDLGRVLAKIELGL